MAAGGSVPLGSILLVALIGTAAAGAEAPKCSGKPTANETTQALIRCYETVQSSLASNGLLPAAKNVSDVTGMVISTFNQMGAIEPLALYSVAAFFNRWPNIFGGILAGSPLTTWNYAKGFFDLHCKYVVGPFTSCVTKAASPLCPGDFANVRNLMNNWAGRYCNVKLQAPKPDVITRLGKDFSKMTNVMTCVISNSASGTDFRSDMGKFVETFFADCMDGLAISVLMNEFTSSVYLNTDIFQISPAARRTIFALGRCGMRTYDKFCPGALDREWATLNYSLNLLLANLTGAPLTPADVAWKMPTVAIGSASPHSVVKSFGDNWLYNYVDGKLTQCLSANSVSYLLVSNRFYTITRTPFSLSGSKGQYVVASFYQTNGGNKTQLGTFTLTGFSFIGINFATSSFVESLNSTTVTELVAGGKVAISLTNSTNGVSSIVDKRSASTIRFYVNRFSEIAVVLYAPKDLLKTSFGTLVQGCMVQNSTATFKVPKPACLSKCATNSACKPADCALASSYTNAGYNIVDAMSKF